MPSPRGWPPAHPASLGSATAWPAQGLLNQARIQKGGAFSQSFIETSNQKHLEIHGMELEASGQSSSLAGLGICYTSLSHWPLSQQPLLQNGPPSSSSPFH